MEIKYNKREKTVGMFIISLIFLLLICIVLLSRGQNWFKESVVYYTMFDENYNLKKNSAVKMFKADIGEIEDIVIVEDKVKITLAIYKEFATRIRIDAEAAVASPTFIGGEYVSITPGLKTSPVLDEGKTIRSIKKKSFSDIMDDFEIEKTAKKFIKAIQGVSDMAESLNDPNGPLFLIINNVESIVHDISQGKGSLGKLLKTEILMTNIISKLDRLDNILKNIEKTTDKTPDTIDYLNNNLKNLELAQEHLIEILIKVEDSAVSLKETLNNLKKGSCDVPRVTKTTKLGVQEIRDGVDNINKVVNSMKKNIFIRSNLSPEKKPEDTDAGL